MTAKTFPQAERDVLLAVKGVGPKVIERFEQLGIYSLRSLSTRDTREICVLACALTGGSCWKNSPQARKAVADAIAAAQSALRD